MTNPVDERLIKWIGHLTERPVDSWQYWEDRLRVLLANNREGIENDLLQTIRARFLAEAAIGGGSWLEAINELRYIRGNPDITQPCCANEKRNMNGGCESCGDPCI